MQKAIKKVTNFDKLSKQIKMTVTAEGLRIELLESEKGTFFDLGSPQPNNDGRELLATIAAEIGKVPNEVSIEGQTDSRPYDGGGYSNWELSVDRANAARKIMSDSGLKPDQIAQVRGYADRKLRVPNDPENAVNRRISVIVHYLETEQDAPKETEPAKEAAASKASE